MPGQQTIRACKSAIADLVKWLKTSALSAICQKVLWLKKKFIVIVKGYELSNDVTVQQPDDFELIGNLQCCLEAGLGLQKEQVFTVKIRGKIQTDANGRRVSLKLFLDEFDNINERYTPIYQKSETGCDSKQVPFDYVCELGKINDKEKEFADWVSVAKIKPEWMLLARKGNRRVRLRAQLFNCENSDVYAQCQTYFEFYNRQWGYLDITENTERARALAVTLAFALSAADGRMYKCEIEKINEWALSTYQADKDKKARKELLRALKKTVGFFKKGHRVNIQALCKELSEITEVWQRYDILSFCLNVVETKGFISAGQIKILKDLSKCFDIEQESFRSMLERLAPVNTYEVKDTELILGLFPELSKEQKRELLNNEYKKWNSRVTNVNPQIQSQAEQMLELITEARSKCLS